MLQLNKKCYENTKNTTERHGVQGPTHLKCDNLHLQRGLQVYSRVTRAFPQGTIMSRQPFLNTLKVLKVLDLFQMPCPLVVILLNFHPIFIVDSLPPLITHEILVIQDHLWISTFSWSFEIIYLYLVLILEYLEYHLCDTKKYPLQHAFGQHQILLSTQRWPRASRTSNEFATIHAKKSIVDPLMPKDLSLSTHKLSRAKTFTRRYANFPSNSTPNFSQFDQANMAVELFQCW